MLTNSGPSSGVKIRPFRDYSSYEHPDSALPCLPFRSFSKPVIPEAHSHGGRGGGHGCGGDPSTSNPMVGNLRDFSSYEHPGSGLPCLPFSNLSKPSTHEGLSRNFRVGGNGCNGGASTSNPVSSMRSRVFSSGPATLMSPGVFSTGPASLMEERVFSASRSGAPPSRQTSSIQSRHCTVKSMHVEESPDVTPPSRRASNNQTRRCTVNSLLGKRLTSPSLDGSASRQLSKGRPSGLRSCKDQHRTGRSRRDSALRPSRGAVNTNKKEDLLPSTVTDRPSARMEPALGSADAAVGCTSPHWNRGASPGGSDGNEPGVDDNKLSGNKTSYNRYRFEHLPRDVCRLVLAAIYTFGKQSGLNFSLIQEAINLFSPYRFPTSEIIQYVKSLQKNLGTIRVNYCPACDTEMGTSEESKCQNDECSLFRLPLTHGKRKITVVSVSIQKQLETLLRDQKLFNCMVWSGNKNADYVEGVFDSVAFTEWNNSDTSQPLYIRLGIGTDGFQYDSKGYLHCWGMMALVMNLPQRVREKLQHCLFVSLCLWNSADNPPFHRMLEGFEQELRTLETEGFEVYIEEMKETILFKVKVIFYTMDNKGRKVLVGNCSHNSYFPCHKCIAKGKRRGHYPGVNKITYVARKGKTFHVKRYPRWNRPRYTKVRRIHLKHPGRRSLWSIQEATYFMRRTERILQLPVEPMHNLYQGTFRDLDRFFYWRFYSEHNMSLRAWSNDICEFIASIMVPTNTRKAPRAIDENKRKTANSTLIEKETCGPIWMYHFLGLRKQKWQEVAYLLLKCCTTRSLNEQRISKDELGRLERMMEIVSLATATILGPEACTSKLHQDLHMVEDYLRFGHLNEVQMFVFESFWNLLKQEAHNCTRGVGEQMLEAGLVKLVIRKMLEDYSIRYPDLKPFLRKIDFNSRSLPSGFEEINEDLYYRPTVQRVYADHDDVAHISRVFGEPVEIHNDLEVIKRVHINGQIVSSEEWTQARLTSTAVICFQLNGSFEYGVVELIFKTSERVFLKVRHFPFKQSLLQFIDETILTDEHLKVAWQAGYFRRVDDFWRIVTEGDCVFIESNQFHSMASICELDGNIYAFSYSDVYKAP